MPAWSPPNSEHAPPKADEPPLHGAARTGDAEAIRRFLQNGADINVIFNLSLHPEGRDHPATPLMVAAGSGDGASLETVDLLLTLGANPRTVTEAGSAATFACNGLGWNYKPGGDAARLKRLLAAGSPLPPDPEDRNRLLCETAATGDAARLKVLLQHGLSAKGYSDPQLAKERSQEAKTHFAESPISTPDFFESLPAELRESVSATMREMEDRMIQDQASAPLSFEIPLFRAAQSGSVECINALLAAGADPAVRDSTKCTAMYFVGSAEAARVLTEAGVPLEDANTYGWSPLDDAVSDGEAALPRVRSLLAVGANPNATHDRGYTVFMSAVGSGRYPEILRLLIEAGANPNAVSDLGYNAFHAAIDVNFEANTEESVRDTLSYLKQLGVNMEHRNKSTQTPLARALEHGTGLEVQVLCELGANPNAIGPKHQCGGGTCTSTDLPLLFHAADGIGVDKDVKTEALLKAGADPLVRDRDSHTALERAVARLCADADDYSSSFDSFFARLRTLHFERDEVPRYLDAFIQAALPPLKSFVADFASAIPVSEKSEFAQEWRDQTISCIALLSAYEAWARRQRSAT
jgi:ankyrin repeat protein